MIYEKVIVIGSGKIASDCLDILSGYTDSVAAIEHEKHLLSAVKTTCSKKNIEYSFIESREVLENYLLDLPGRTLVVSANNNFIFAEPILQKPEIKIINFHNALLPSHRGRNAPTWAIYEMDELTGITWHEVSGGVDEGNIIIQRKIPIDSKTTALMLTRKCMEMGSEAFRECIKSVLDDSYASQAQDEKLAGEMHNSRSVPNDGILDLAWPIDKISAFLRSLDYGALEILPKPRINLLGNGYMIDKYALKDSEKGGCEGVAIDEDGNIVCTSGETAILMKIK